MVDEEILEYVKLKEQATAYTMQVVDLLQKIDVLNEQMSEIVYRKERLNEKRHDLLNERNH